MATGPTGPSWGGSDPSRTRLRHAGNLDEYGRLSEPAQLPALKKWGDIDKDIREMCDANSAVGFAVIAHKLGGKWSFLNKLDDLGGYVKTHLRARFKKQQMLDSERISSESTKRTSESPQLKPEWEDVFLRVTRVQKCAWVLDAQPALAAFGSRGSAAHCAFDDIAGGLYWWANQGSRNCCGVRPTSRCGWPYTRASSAVGWPRI